MAKDTPRNLGRSETKIRRGELRVGPSAVKAFNKETRNSNRVGKGANIRTTSSGFKASKSSSSPARPSVASAAVKGAKNKMKAQGAKATSAPTARYKQGMRNK